MYSVHPCGLPRTSYNTSTHTVPLPAGVMHKKSALLCAHLRSVWHSTVSFLPSAPPTRARWELAKRSFSGEGIGDGDGGGAQGGEQGAGIGEGEGGHHDDRGYDDDDACGGVELLLPRSLADFLGEDRVQVRGWALGARQDRLR